ncbi:MAG TPA: O-acetyl-ADP-ribose deacetylase [Candidatus Protoclostridium stercorigallinarum]|uniref:O-acetyl-ADP-ribose deacetylase n=1 Tax=Candidatus Protoclostridium stercorigallinarum TaxID=2838741 RepID=A0A9D1PYW5_9FIRM|nr:O-acetyl-ADP-ribose deacetylase [Candidatus Protoclostridium stercorigallinarum]
MDISKKYPVTLVCGDITKIKADAIVNAANETLLGGGGVDGAIHAAAGPRLLEECRTLGGCRTGEAKLTKGYDLPAKYVIHTVGPIYTDGARGERALLESCYRSCMDIAKREGFRSVAFPLISAGVYGYPRDEAIEVALTTLAPYAGDTAVTLVLYSRPTYEAACRIAGRLFEND